MTTRPRAPAEIDHGGIERCRSVDEQTVHHTTAHHVAHHATTTRGVLLLGVVLAIAVVVALVLDRGHPAWRNAVILAAAITGMSSVGGWLASRGRSTSPGQGVARALAGTALRILLPLAALGWLTASGGPLLEAGCSGLIVAFYLPLLATTILLHMMGEAGHEKTSGQH
jgi:hypothetical protein